MSFLKASSKQLEAAMDDIISENKEALLELAK